VIEDPPSSDFRRLDDASDPGVALGASAAARKLWRTAWRTEWCDEKYSDLVEFTRIWSNLVGYMEAIIEFGPSFFNFGIFPSPKPVSTLRRVSNFSKTPIAKLLTSKELTSI